MESIIEISPSGSPMPKMDKFNKRGDCVATKSVFKNIDIKTRDTALSLVNALENAKGNHSQPVKKTCVFSDASREEIRKMFYGAK